MARNEGVWQKLKKTISNEVQDDERLAANLGAKHLCFKVRRILTGKVPLTDVLHCLNSVVKCKVTELFDCSSVSPEELNASSGKNRAKLHERIRKRRLLRSVALFAGSVFVMRNFGELMAV